MRQDTLSLQLFRLDLCGTSELHQSVWVLKTGEGRGSLARKLLVWAFGGSFCIASPELEIFGRQTTVAARRCCIRHKYRSNNTEKWEWAGEYNASLHMSPKAYNEGLCPALCPFAPRKEQGSRRAAAQRWRLSMAPLCPTVSFPTQGCTQTTARHAELEFPHPG